MEKQTEHERNRPNENRMDPDSWSWNTLDEPTSQLPTGTLHQSEHQQIKFSIKLEKERQWSSTCCFGRGKKLSDIVVPRLPKVFLNEDFPSADSSLQDMNWQNKGRRNYSLQRPHAVGRGVMFQDVPVSQLADPYITDVEYVLGKASAEPAAPIRTTASTIKNDPRRHLLLMGDNSDLESFPVRESNKKSAWCVQSNADFPALPVGISTSSGPLRSRGVGGQLTSSDIFKDAEEPAPEPSSDFTHVSQRIESEIQNKTDSFADLLITSASVENETDANIACSGDFMEPSAVLSRGGGPRCGLTSGPDGCKTLLWKGGCEGTSNSSAGMTLQASLPESLYCPESGATEGTVFPDNLSQEDNDGIPAEDGASTPKARPPVSRKKKFPSGWRLGGACVVEIANTPKGCAEELRDMVNVIAKVEDFKKKKRNGNLFCRFSFQSKEKCDEVISYFDGHKPFDGQSKALECHRLDGGETLETDE